jgi:hypothetical protein
MRDYAIHDYFSHPGPSFQQLGGMCFSPTKGIPFSSLLTTQESKKCSKFENFAKICSWITIVEYNNL